MNFPSAQFHATAAADGLQHALSLLDSHFPEKLAAVDGGVVSYREMAAGADAALPVVVLLHGIGSGAASWLPCALDLARNARVIAWNAPGYGNSDRLPAARPAAAAYAARLRQLLDALGIKRCTLAGHSLGAMMASAFAGANAGMLERLVLLSPARGYGIAGRLEQGTQVARERLSTLGELGVHGLATQRSARLVSGQADTLQRDWVRWNMAQLRADGYTQAVHLLCGDAIENYAPAVPGAVWCGSADRITTPEDSRAVAERFGLPFALIENAGHACYVEQPGIAAAAILQH
ncbi:alpha/beta fold hydrolase [Pseudoduganella sp. RAF53_2]|uniref:alpha/beta fold hydrolase n=1 Tax=unclassified Pseudoduganella TaxID=2637179 RepID=UPI003F962EBF